MMFPSVAGAEQQLTVDVYEQYSFDFHDHSYERDCEGYIRRELALLNQWQPFCVVDDIGRWLNKGWKIQHSTGLKYSVRPPKFQRWDCVLSRVECTGERFYLFGG